MSIFSRIFGGSKNQLGIDLGSSFLKIAEVSKEKERVRLTNYALTALEKDQIKLTDKEAADVIKKTLAEARIKFRKANFSIPLFSSFSTIIEVPLLPGKELEEAIPFEARQYIPISVSEVSLDWTILASDALKKTSTILLVAVPLETVNRYSQISKGAGLSLNSLEIESFSILRSFNKNKSAEAVCFVDIGSRSTNIIIIDQGWTVISHYYEIGSSNLTRVLQQSLNISLERAESLKISIGLAGLKEDREISSLLFIVVDKILAEVQRTLAAYYKNREKKITKIFVGGGGARLKGLIQYFNSQFGIESVPAESFSNVIFPSELKPAIEDLNPIFPVAVGLALKDL